MRKVARLAAAVLFIAPLAAEAIPIDYAMVYTADAGGGPDGLGSFTYDADTQILSNLEWLFDDGTAGALTVSSDFLAENILLKGCLSTCTVGAGPSALSGDFINAGWGYSLLNDVQSYSFLTAAEVSYFGVFTVIEIVTPVPEPGTLSLMAVGFAVLAWRRRKRLGTAVAT